METRKFTQIGTFFILVFGVVVLVCLANLLLLSLDNPGFYILLFVTVVFIIGLLIFYKLTITIDDTNLTLYFGIGLFKKSFKLSEIKTCRVVKNSLFYGIGIKIIPNGMLYNVSGLNAIELDFKNKKSIVRIGTDQPMKICQFIKSKIGTGFQVDSM